MPIEVYATDTGFALLSGYRRLAAVPNPGASLEQAIC